MKQEAELAYFSSGVQSTSWTHTDLQSQHEEINVGTKLKSVDEKLWRAHGPQIRNKKFKSQKIGDKTLGQDCRGEQYFSEVYDTTRKPKTIICLYTYVRLSVYEYECTCVGERKRAGRGIHIRVHYAWNAFLEQNCTRVNTDQHILLAEARNEKKKNKKKRKQKQMPVTCLSDYSARASRCLTLKGFHFRDERKVWVSGVQQAPRALSGGTCR